MKITLHLSPFAFSKTINDISFNKKLSAEKVESDYYINAILFLMKKFYSVINFNKYRHNNFVIDGESISPKQTLFDWTCLCNYLKNKLIELKLNFNFYENSTNGTNSINCNLYYLSVVENTQKTISFSLKPCISAKPVTNNDDDTKPTSSSGSGGKSQMLIKPTEQDLKKFFNEYNKIYNKANSNQSESREQSLLSKKINHELVLETAKSISPGIENFIKASDSIIKNNPPETLSSKSLESKLADTFGGLKTKDPNKHPFLNGYKKPSNYSDPQKSTDQPLKTPPPKTKRQEEYKESDGPGKSEDSYRL